MRKLFLPLFFIIFLFALIFTSCTSTSVSSEHIIQETQDIIEEVISTQEQEPTPEPEPEPLKLTLTFGRDIMAHTQNFSMKNYSIIYENIESIIKNDDLTFANLEVPVHSGRPYENYPTFNVQPPYPEAAISAGFDVFSLANNHTNDQGLEGIEETLKFFTSKKDQDVYYAGIKSSTQENLSYQIIEKNGWKILFVAITEILNQPAYKNRIDYIEPSKTKREEFKLELKKLREENPCDLFILSIHTCEDEYVHKITDLRRNLYKEYIENGVDIIWANHPHLAKEWEIISRKSQSEFNVTENLPEQTNEIQPSALVMYALGNTISGQRRNPRFDAPETNRDYTGDGYLIQVEFEKPYDAQNISTDDAIKNPNFRITKITPHLITTYIDPKLNYVIKLLNETFIQQLKDEGNLKWADYLLARKKLMDKIKGKEIIYE